MAQFLLLHDDLKRRKAPETIETLYVLLKVPNTLVSTHSDYIT